MANGIRLTMTLGTNTTDRTVEVHGTITSRLQGSACPHVWRRSHRRGHWERAIALFGAVFLMALLSMSSARIFAALSYA